MTVTALGSRFSGIDGSRAEGRATVELARRLAPMFVRGLARKASFAHSGGPLFIGRGVRVSNAYQISHQGRLVIEDFAEVQGLSRSGIRFGDEVSIGAASMIRPSSYYGGEIGEGLTIGDRSSMGAGCFIGCSGQIVIGDDVMLGPGVRLFAENHLFDDPQATIKSQGVERGTIVIEDDCWLASGVTVTADVRIGRGSVVGAASVVTADIPPYSVAAGVPARVLRSRR